jgi:hypothetical protein
MLGRAHYIGNDPNRKIPDFRFSKYTTRYSPRRIDSQTAVEYFNG